MISLEVLIIPIGIVTLGWLIRIESRLSRIEGKLSIVLKNINKED